MRQPEDGHDLASLAGVRVFPLDVTSTERVEAAVGMAHEAFGRLDFTVTGKVALPIALWLIPTALIRWLVPIVFWLLMPMLTRLH